MLTTKKINELLNIKEAYQASDKLLKLLMDETTRKELFDAFLQIESDLSYDWFHQYFQDEQSDRKNKKQDFTPNEIGKLLALITQDKTNTLDVAAGTGGLTIQKWKKNKKGIFICEELSERALPFLLFNLSIREMNAYVLHGDSLELEYTNIYKINGREITEIDEIPNVKINNVIMNPPFSANWNQVEDERFENYDLAPKSKADYAFLLHGLHNLENNGLMGIVLPHGVLFRSGREQKIRKKLLEQGTIKAVIGLPEKIFVNTDIPTVILVLEKGKENKNVMFIDASKEFTKQRNINQMEDNHINKIYKTYLSEKEIDKFSKLIPYKEIVENDFNLNIPRFIDTFEEPEPIDVIQLSNDIQKIEKELKENKKEFLNMVDDLQVTDENKEIIDAIKAVFEC